MFNHPLIWMFAILFAVLGLLLYYLVRWNKKLKTTLSTQLANHNATSSQLLKVEAASKKTTNFYVIAFVVVVIAIFGVAIFAYEYYETEESIITSVTELILISAALAGGFLLGGLWRRHEAIHFLGQLLGQKNQRERVERRISLSEGRLENQQLALSTLTQNQLQNWHEPSEVFRELAMISAQTLNVERVGVWLFNAERTQLNCSDLYLKTQHLHTEAEPLVRQDLPQYFNALENNRLIIANDVMQHEAAVELIKDYMPTHSIGATLEATIWINNQFIGVICHEHIGGVREWTLDEQNFVGSIAALASLTIETHRRRTAEQSLLERSAQLEQMVQARTLSLQESNQRFSYVVQEAPIAILIIDRNGHIIELNNEAASASGYSAEQLMGKHFIKTIVAKESRAKARIMAARALQGENFKHVELLLQNAVGEKYEYECSVGMTAKNASDSSGHMVAIAQNISQQKALQKSLIKAREAAESADRTKSMFVAAMSHELRTPLNSIIGFLGIVLQGISGELNSAQKGQLDRAYQSSKHLLLLISDVLDVSKIEAGFLQLNIEKFELKPLLIELEHAVQHLLAGKDLALGIVCTAKLQVTTDRKRLYQVLLNVLSNAVKYTEQGSIQMKVHIEDNQLIVICQDTGIGIDEADFARLFQPFVRVESPLTIKTSGTGLGLYLTHKIVTQLLGGSITVHSKLGQGSTFTIIMPINTPAVLALKAASSVEGNVEEVVL
jgi:PAS domain S-box-containing protein